MALKVLIGPWFIFTLLWSAMNIFAWLLGGGASPFGANTDFTFFVYWFGPIVVPAVIYRHLRKRGEFEKSSAE